MVFTYCYKSDKIMATVEEIKEKRRELEKLEEEYLNETPPCNNKECSFWKERATGCCTWSVLLEDCIEYEPNE